MRKVLAFGFLATGLLVAACNRTPAVDEQLKKDLEAVGAGAIELAPRGQGTQIVSALESKQPAQPRVTQTRRTPDRAPAPTPRPEIRQEAPTSSEPVVTIPRQLPPSSVSTPRNPRSVGDVIRNAPFPINPATQTKRP